MNNSPDEISQLLLRLEALLKKQESFEQEIQALRNELTRLKSAGQQESIAVETHAAPSSIGHTHPREMDSPPPVRQTESAASFQPDASRMTKPTGKSNIEKFIGENLINKIGIAITVIGVSIGAKYSIEHELISPLTRIILGYLAGIGLLGVGIRLRQNYVNYSAVLVSGAMAILYFITYAAYGLYDLIPQSFAFAMMVLFTAFTVVAAFHYNQSVIAQIGLVGAYAVPFLLSDGSGKIEVMFSYMTILNVGVLIISVKKYWKSLLYSSFLLTWLIYFGWYASGYQQEQHFGLALLFLSVFFVIFYLTFLAYKLLQKEKFGLPDIGLILANSFLFYGIGYAIMDGHDTGEKLVGLYTLGNATVHFIVSAIIYRQKLADRNLFYLVSGLVMVFVTIAIPVQLDGNWVTLLWAAEAALLFWVGRTREVPVYEKIAYPLIFLAFFSLIQDWGMVYGHYVHGQPETKLIPLANIHFLSSLMVVGALAFINWLSQDNQYPSPLRMDKPMGKIISYSLPILFLVVLYFAFYMEISNYWDQRYEDSYLSIPSGDPDYPDIFYNRDLLLFKSLWLFNYSLFFFAALTFFNLKKVKNNTWGSMAMGLNTLALFGFLLTGLYQLSELREHYLDRTNTGYYLQGISYLLMRYISFVFVALLLMASHAWVRQERVGRDLKTAFEFIFHIALLWLASSELIHWMDMGEFSQSYKLGLSILWGLYSLGLIAYGIWKKKKHLRVGAIALFAATLFKLFLYDMSHLDTLAKTIVFVSLGILLLIISFLYTKYKYLIADEPEDN
ncbi:MAG: DUF2339 domain-containing protein [Cyclobacteriaceae bacterium]|nr:DUF2339 domain-containing protein [Cyclobacteriaceae bacterium]